MMKKKETKESAQKAEAAAKARAANALRTQALREVDERNNKVDNTKAPSVSEQLAKLRGSKAAAKPNVTRRGIIALGQSAEPVSQSWVIGVAGATYDSMQSSA